MRRFVEARNTIVKRSALATKSNAQSGIFRGYKMKLVIMHEIPPFVPTEMALKRAVETTVGFLLDEEHSAIGEQVGVRRTWVVDDLGDEEVVGLCVEAHNAIGRVVAEAHELHGYGGEHTPFEANMEVAGVMLETDLDPTLLEKWDW